MFYESRVRLGKIVMWRRYNALPRRMAMRKLFTLLFVMLMTMTLATGSAKSGDQPIKVAYLTKAISNEVWQMMSQGVVELAPQFGMTVTVMDCDNNAAKQVEQVESCVEAGYNVILVSPADLNAVAESCKKAIESGVHIVSVDGPNFHAQAYVDAREHADAYELGVRTAKMVNEKWPDKKEINLCLIEFVFEQACVERAAGLLDGFNSAINAKINMVARISPPDAARANVMSESVLQAYKVDVCMSIAGDQAYGFSMAAATAGVKPDDIIVTAMDITPMSANLLAKGQYIKLLGSWGSPSRDKALVHLKAIQEALKVDGFTSDPVCVYYTPSYVDASTIDKTIKEFGW